MTIKQVMEIGTTGMTEKEKEAEQARRLSVAEKVTKLGEMLKEADEKQKRKLVRSMKRIKSNESAWLREAAWFLYA